MRTYGRQYFDTATATDIVISNGVSSDGASTFPLKGSDGSDIASNLLESVSAVYRTDWQGQQLLYDTPRTNQAIWSSDFTQWTSGSTTVSVSAKVGPDGTNNAQLITVISGKSQGLLNDATYPAPADGYATHYVDLAPGTLGYGVIMIFAQVPSVASAYTYAVFDLNNPTVTPVVVNYTTSGYPPLSNVLTVASILQNGFVRIGVTAYVPSGYTYIIPYFGGTDNPNSFTLSVASDGTDTIYAANYQAQIAEALSGYIPTTNAPVTVTDYTISGTDITLASPLSGWYSGSTYNYALLQWSGTYYGAVNYQTSVKKWVEVDTDANGYNDAVYLTTLAQALKLNLNESPFFANYGIPQYQTIMSQVFPDYYVNMTQTQFAQYFASLTVARLQNTSPTYRIQVQTNYGSIIDTTIAA